MEEDIAAKAKRIIEHNIYITLATASKNGAPWVSPVYTGHDANYNFYFSSAETAQHIQFIKENNQIMFVMFDSTVVRGKGEGVYMQGKVYELKTTEEVLEAYKYFYSRNDATPHEPSYYLGGSKRKLYKIIPSIIWMNEWSKVNGIYTDVRVEVPLLKK